MELLTVLFVLLAIVIGLKLIFWMVKAGIFLVLLPAKIIIGSILTLGFLLLIPVIALPAIFAIFIPLIPLILIAFGVFLLVKYVV